jgi:hypothetical protein
MPRTLDAALAEWCAATGSALQGHDGIMSIRRYDQADFDRDHGETWAESP